MNISRQLFELQELDSDIENREQTLQQDERELGNRQALEQALSNLTSQQQQLEELKHKQKNAEWEVDDLQNKITAAEEKLYSGKIVSPKELSSLQQDIKTLKARNSQMESEALEIIDKVEELEGKTAAASRDFKNMENSWQARQQHLQEEIQQLKSSLAELNKQRRQLASEVEAEALSLYERVRKAKRPAMTTVDRGICGTCRISLSSAQIQESRSGQPTLCTSCGRILFFP